MKIIRRAYEEALLKFGANNIGTQILLFDYLCIYHHLSLNTAVSLTNYWHLSASVVNTLVFCSLD